MPKRKSPANLLNERTITNGKFKEQFAIKYPGEEIISADREREHDSVQYDSAIEKEAFEKHRKKRYSILHTHSSMPLEETSVEPSVNDLLFFLRDDKSKSITIVDYWVNIPIRALTIRKTKKTPKLKFLKDFSFPALEMLGGLPLINKLFPNSTYPEITKKIIRDYHLQTRERDLQDSVAERKRYQKYLPKQSPEEAQKKNLEGAVAGMIFFSSLILLIFFSPSLTGNVILNIPKTFSSSLSITLLIITLISGIFFLTKLKKHKK